MRHLHFDWHLVPGEHTPVFLLKKKKQTNLTVWKWTVSWMIITVHILQRNSAHAYSTSLGRTFSACGSVEVVPSSLPLGLENILATEETQTHWIRFASITSACTHSAENTCSRFGGEEFPHFHSRTQGSYNPHSQNHFHPAEIGL